ncbi:MAG: 5-formyltetrahydrofolate cyclo-ligase [Deferribacterota bacterium]|nr:5-formyltetrahydrofolate cyclo-ligase [Deferribacterota bacterium]
MNKEQLRKIINIKRNNLTKEYVDNISQQIVERFLHYFDKYFSFILYCEKDNEVKASPLINILLSKKKVIYLPIYDKNICSFGRVFDFSELALSKYGILEPKNRSNVDQVDVIVVPGLAYDIRGNRLGRGAGFYDKVLKNLKVKFRIAFAYDFQVLDSIPADDLDERVDFVITEKKIIGGSNG